MILQHIYNYKPVHSPQPYKTSTVPTNAVVMIGREANTCRLVEAIG